MRTKYAVLNLLTAWSGKIVIVLFNFILRIVFIQYLSIEYLGVNGLFSNILSILSLADLGISTAIIYSLYRPLENKDETIIKALMGYYKKAYWYIGIIIFLIGVSFIPFLSFFINEETQVKNLEVIYFIFVLETASTYFFSYKANFIIANQKSFIVNLYTNGVKLLRIVISIVVLMFWRNFMAYLLVQLGSTLLENVLISRKAEKMYPILKEKNNEKLSIELRGEIKRNTIALLFHRIGDSVVNGTDYLIMSKFINMISVGIYSNYNMIIQFVHNMLGQFFQSLAAGVGNFSVKEEKGRQQHLFWQIFFIGFWLYGICSVILFCLINPFVTLWVGEDFLFSKEIVIVLVINFYITGMRKPVLTFRDAMGLFWKERYKAIIEALLNIVVSLLLVKQYGVIGIFVGTLFSTVATCLWVEPYVLFRYAWNRTTKKYFLYYLYYSMVTLITGGTAFHAVNQIVGNTLIFFLIKSLVCFGICFMCFLLGSLPTYEGRLFLKKIIKVIKR